MSRFTGLGNTRAVAINTGESIFSVSGSGDNLFNLESISGLLTTGLIYVYGNENGVNQTFAMYSYNLSYYSDTSTRYIRLKEIHRSKNENGYGNFYLYLSTYSGDRTNPDQYATSNSSSISDIYARNEVGYIGNIAYLITRYGL